MSRSFRPVFHAAVCCFLVAAVGCTSSGRSEEKLFGKWQSEPNKWGNIELYEFLRDGSVIHNLKRSKRSWEANGAGTFKFIDPTHVKVELQPNWYFGVSIYEVMWQDSDHVGLRIADNTMRLSRVK